MSGAADRTSLQGAGGFEETLKDFWATRPRRPLRGRKIAGVAAAIGQRYGIDPVVVRVVFVTATIFSGVGLSLYLLGWLLFPGEGDEVSPIEALLGRGRSSLSKGFTLVLACAFVPLTGWAFGGGWFNGSGVLGLALLVTALYLLHRGRGQENRDAYLMAQPASAATASASKAASPTEATGDSSWDALGAAPLGWDFPDLEPAPPSPPPRPPAPRQNKKVGIVTFALALLVAGAGVGLNALGVTWFSIPHIIGLSLGVLGIGMVVGAFLNGGRGLVGWAIPLAIAGLAATAVPIGGFGGGVNRISSAPTTAAAVLPVYQHSAGDINLNLSAIPESEPVSTQIRNGAGQTMVFVSETADVDYDCSLALGSVNCLSGENAGPGANARGTDYGSDGPGGGHITLKISGGVGSVEVQRVRN